METGSKVANVLEIKQALNKIVEGVSNLEISVRKNQKDDIEALFVSHEKAVISKIIQYFQDHNISIQERKFNIKDPNSKWANKSVACILNPPINLIKLVHPIAEVGDAIAAFKKLPQYQKELYKLPPGHEDLLEQFETTECKRVTEEIIRNILKHFVQYYNMQKKGEVTQIRSLEAEEVLILRAGIENALYQFLAEKKSSETKMNVWGELLLIDSKTPKIALQLYQDLANFIQPAAQGSDINLKIPSNFCIKDRIVTFLHDENAKKKVEFVSAKLLTPQQQARRAARKQELLEAVTKGMTNALAGISNVKGTEIDFKQLYRFIESFNDHFIPALYKQNNEYFNQKPQYALSPVEEFPIAIYQELFTGLMQYVFRVNNSYDIESGMETLRLSANHIAELLFYQFISTLKERKEEIKIGEGDFLKLPKDFPIADLFKNIEKIKMSEKLKYKS